MTERVQHGEQVVDAAELDVLGLRAAEPPGVVADRAVAGVRQQRNERFPHARIDDACVQEHDRRSVALSDGGQAATGHRDHPFVAHWSSLSLHVQGMRYSL